VAIGESLRPNYAVAEQVPQDDKRLKTEYATVPSPQGNSSVRGYSVRPANAQGKLPGALVLYENHGLNRYIEDVARRLGTANFLAFAPDGLTSVGGYTGDDERAQNFLARWTRIKCSKTL
jgi:carboxymethylenebutenolidase